MKEVIGPITKSHSTKMRVLRKGSPKNAMSEKSDAISFYLIASLIVFFQLQIF